MTQEQQQIKTFYSDKYEQECYLCKHGLHGKELHQTLTQAVSKTQNQSQTQTFYSDKYEQQCYLCQHGLHGKEFVHASPAVIVGDPQVVYTTPDIIVSQTIGEPISSKKGAIVVNQSQYIANTPPRIDYTQSQLVQSPPLQNFQINVQQSPQLVQQNNYEYGQINQQIVPQVVQQQIIPNQQQQITYNSQQLVNQNQIIVPQVQNQQIITSQANYQQIMPPQQQQIIYNQQQLINSQNYQQNQLIVPQVQNSQIITNQANYQQIIPSSEYQYTQYNQTFGPNYQVQQLQPVTASIQTFGQNVSVQQTRPEIKTIQTIQVEEQKQLTAKEQVELFWRNKLYELQEREYELLMMIENQKQQTLHSRSGSQVKKSSVDTFKLQQVQNEVQQLDAQLKIKQMTIMDMRNKLNEMIYRQDPSEDATRYKEQELQQIRQRYNTLNFKVQSNQEDIAMTQAVIEAIKSGKGYKLVSIKTQQQSSVSGVTSSQNQQTSQFQGNQSYKGQLQQQQS